MNSLLSQKWCLCLNVQNRIKSCRAKNDKFGDETTVFIQGNKNFQGNKKFYFYTHINTYKKKVKT